MDEEIIIDVATLDECEAFMDGIEEDFQRRKSILIEELAEKHPSMVKNGKVLNFRKNPRTGKF